MLQNIIKNTKKYCDKILKYFFKKTSIIFFICFALYISRIAPLQFVNSPYPFPNSPHPSRVRAILEWVRAIYKIKEKLF
jgi:hypothetical protein